MNTPGRQCPEIPVALVEGLQLKELSYRNGRHWVGRGNAAFHKLAPQGSIGERPLRLEGEILHRLKHPNIVRGQLMQMYDWVILQMEAIPGETLTKLREKLTTDDKLKILEEVESAISYINGKGVLHADVSSENVIWDGSRSYLIDFEEARYVVPPIRMGDSPDVIGGPPCCWGDIGYGYSTYLCLDSLRAWLLTPEFLDLKENLARAGTWTPASPGNTCEAWTTPDDGSVYQTVSFANETIYGQRDPELRFRYLSASKKVSFHNKRVLDVGCNFGRLGAFLETLGISQYVGIELSSDYVDVSSRLARLEGLRKCHFVRGDICGDDTEKTLKTLSPKGYDVLVCQSTYHHLVDKQMFWKRVSDLGPQWLVFEGPVNDSSYLLTASWAEEKQFIRTQGYRISLESNDNDYPGRILALFEKVASAA